MLFLYLTTISLSIQPLSLKFLFFHLRHPQHLDDNIQLYIDDGKCKYSKPSTVVDVSDGKIKILRKGVEWIKK
ncbi:MAG: Sua5/YciO/YrdC/YwlC family protein [Candidatus Thermoplasmatota archaeon]|nr:Sua5/YciO/YrdC/YwlC family protein [Candidatus Thermoplasmatota archaeon]